MKSNWVELLSLPFIPDKLKQHDLYTLLQKVVAVMQCLDLIEITDGETKTLPRYSYNYTKRKIEKFENRGWKLLINDSNYWPFELLKKLYAFFWMCFLYAKVKPVSMKIKQPLFSWSKSGKFEAFKNMKISFSMFKFSNLLFEYNYSCKISTIFKPDKRNDLNIPSQYWFSYQNTLDWHLRKYLR